MPPRLVPHTSATPARSVRENWIGAYGNPGPEQAPTDDDRGLDGRGVGARDSRSGATARETDSARVGWPRARLAETRFFDPERVGTFPRHPPGEPPDQREGGSARVFGHRLVPHEPSDLSDEAGPLALGSHHSLPFMKQRTWEVKNHCHRPSSCLPPTGTIEGGRGAVPTPQSCFGFLGALAAGAAFPPGWAPGGPEVSPRRAAARVSTGGRSCRAQISASRRNCVST